MASNTGRPDGSTDESVNKRIDECAAKIRAGLHNYQEFIDWATGEFDINKSNANKYWKKAWAKVKVEFESEKQTSKVKRILQLESAYRDEKDTKKKADIIMQISKLEGHDIDRKEVNKKVETRKIVLRD